MSDPLLLERLDRQTAVITLNRPERRNALSIAMMESLSAALDASAEEPRMRVVIVRGAGPAFCSGLDLVEAAEMELAETSAAWVARTFASLVSSPLVTVAAAHGAAYAGGAGLLACCDFVVAAEDLRVSLPEVRRGLVPALALVALGRRLRDGDLRQLAFLGEPIDAARARQIGLVDWVVAGDQLMAVAERIAEQVSQGAPDAVRDTKRLLRELGGCDTAEAFGAALEFHKRARTSVEASEGLAAYRERRPPAWADADRAGQRKEGLP